MFGATGPATKALQQVPFFSGLGKEDAEALARRLVPRRFGVDQIIFHHGDPGGLLYIITSGKVKISYSMPDGQEALLAILGAGDFFGELALLDEAPRSATAEAMEQTETLTLHRDDFINHIGQNPEFAYHVMRTLTKRIRHLNDQISDVFFLDLNGRLARTLLNLAENHGRPVAEGTLIDIALTQTDLAEMTGATRVSINKTLGRFRRARWVGLRGRRLILLDIPALRELIHLAGG
ncbi:MAG TPA: Crp/Fnr family transcriptional regulator [Candidatus Binatia bacterium]|nr:Crp/Fnr family transcriptional regulator [Candidatus Binatia bacterium]